MSLYEPRIPSDHNFNGVSAMAKQVTVSPDGELIGLVDQFNAIDEKIKAMSRERALESAQADWEPPPPDGDANDAAMDALMDLQEPLFARAMQVEPVTVEGVRALVRLSAIWNPDLAVDAATGGSYRPKVTWSLLRDLAALQA